MDRPSPDHAGSRTPRSSLSVSRRGVPPSAEITASRSWSYANTGASRPVRYAIHLPSGLHAERAEYESSPSQVVSWRGCAPGFASITKRSLWSVRSPSGRRLLENRMREPSGDQTGRASSKLPRVSVSSVLPAMS